MVFPSGTTQVDLRVPCKTSLVMAVLCAAAVTAAAIALKLERGPTLVAALSLPMVALPVALGPVIVVLGDQRSERSLAELIRSELPAETEIVGCHAWRPSLSFYLQRTIPIVSEDGDELRSNYIPRTYHRWVDLEGVLRPPPGPLADPGACEQPRVLLVHRQRPDLQARLDAADLEVLWRGPKLVAYACDPLDNSARGGPIGGDRTP